MSLVDAINRYNGAVKHRETVAPDMAWTAEAMVEYYLEKFEQALGYVA